MKIIITTSPWLASEEFTRFSSISRVPKGVSRGIDVLVLHKTNDSDDLVMRTMKKLKVGRIYYISSAETASDTLKTFIIGLGGTWIDDEIYIEEPDLLHELVSNPSIGKSIQSSGSSDVISNFNERVAKGETDFNPAYLRMVSKTTSDALAERDKAYESALEAARASVQIFDQASLSSTKNAESAQRLQEELTRLKEYTSTVPSSGSTVVSYPVVTNSSKNKTLVVKQLGNVPHLFSLMLGFTEYLAKKRIRWTMLVIVPPGEVYETKYSNVRNSNFIAKNDLNKLRNLINKPIVFTSHPISKVINTFYSKNGYEIYIVLDLTTDKIIPQVRIATESKIRKTFYAVQSERLMKACKVPAAKSFSSIRPIEGTMFTIPFFEGYSDREQMRVSDYLNACSDFYSTLNMER